MYCIQAVAVVILILSAKAAEEPTKRAVDPSGLLHLSHAGHKVGTYTIARVGHQGGAVPVTSHGGGGGAQVFIIGGHPPKITTHVLGKEGLDELNDEDHKLQQLNFPGGILLHSPGVAHTGFPSSLGANGFGGGHTGQGSGGFGGFKAFGYGGISTGLGHGELSTGLGHGGISTGVGHGGSIFKGLTHDGISTGLGHSGISGTVALPYSGISTGLNYGGISSGLSHGLVSTGLKHDGILSGLTYPGISATPPYGGISKGFTQGGISSGIYGGLNHDGISSGLNNAGISSGLIHRPVLSGVTYATQPEIGYSHLLSHTGFPSSLGGNGNLGVKYLQQDGGHSLGTAGHGADSDVTTHDYGFGVGHGEGSVGGTHSQGSHKINSNAGGYSDGHVGSAGIGQYGFNYGGNQGAQPTNFGGNGGSTLGHGQFRGYDSGSSGGLKSHEGDSSSSFESSDIGKGYGGSYGKSGSSEQNLGPAESYFGKFSQEQDDSRSSSIEDISSESAKGGYSGEDFSGGKSIAGLGGAGGNYKYSFADSHGRTGKHGKATSYQSVILESVHSVPVYYKGGKHH